MTRTDSAGITAIADGAWTVPAPLRFLGVKLDTRMTALRLGDGGLVLISPVPYVEALGQAVTALGPVRGIVAPNALHHLYVGEWMRAYPEALSFAAEGVAAKHPDLSFTHTLGRAFDAAFGADILRVSVDGMPGLCESIFVHRPSMTLVATDLCFFMPHATGLARVFATIMSIRRRPRVEPMFRALIRDRAALVASLAPLREVQIEHLSMCHHAVMSEGAHNALQDVLDQLGVPPTPGAQT